MDRTGIKSSIFPLERGAGRAEYLVNGCRFWWRLGRLYRARGQLPCLTVGSRRGGLYPI
ncbi:MAG TPA: hypothetical protein VJ302_12665 [Blastocatellia bacterium]|nr:hypothetical protein [Blastocatellia bacterium]